MATSKEKVYTKEEVTALGNQETGLREQNRKKMWNVYNEQEKVAVTISPFYAPYLGGIAMISLNGISVHIPSNGQTYKVPKSHAALLLQSIAQIDARQLKLNKMSKVQENFEPSIGAMKII